MSDGPSKPLALRVRLPYETEDAFIERYGSNIERTGVFIATRSLKPEGTPVHFEFILASGVTVLRGQGLVTRSRSDAGGGRSGMSVRFDTLDEASRELVEHVVERRTSSKRAPPGLKSRQGGSPRTSTPEPIPQDREEDVSAGQFLLFQDQGEIEALAMTFATPVPLSSGSLERIAAALGRDAEGEQLPLVLGATRGEGMPAIGAEVPVDAAAKIEGEAPDAESLAASVSESEPGRSAGAADAESSAAALPEPDARGSDGAPDAESIATSMSESEARRNAEAPDAESLAASVSESETGRSAGAADAESSAAAISESEARLSAGAADEESQAATRSEPDTRGRAGAPEAESLASAFSASEARGTAGAPDAESLAPSASEFEARRSEAPDAESPTASMSESGARQSAEAADANALAPSPTAAGAPSTQDSSDSRSETLSRGVGADAERATSPWERLESQLPTRAAKKVDPVVGLDLGGSATRAAVFRGGQLERLALPRSRQGIGELKRLEAIGAELEAQRAALEKHLSLVREDCSQAVGVPVHRAVVSVPASFSRLQRSSWRSAAESAGWEVLRLLDEPAAAAIAFGRGRQLPRKRLLVIDLGAAMLQVAVVQATGDEFEVVAIGGDPRLGGVDFDAALVGTIRPRFSDAVNEQSLLSAIRGAKLALSTVESSELQVSEEVHTFTRAELETALAPTIDRVVSTVERVLELNHLRIAGLDEVLLVGGQARMPRIVERLAAVLGKPVRSDEGMGLNLEGSVAQGAALLADGLLAAERATPGTRFSGALHAPLSIGTRDGSLLRVLERGTRLPAVKTLSFPAEPGASLRIALFEGDAASADACTFLGVAELSLERSGELHLHLQISEDGAHMLHATLPGGSSVQLSLDPSAPSAPDRWPLLRPEPTEQPGVWGALRRLLRLG